MKRALEGIKVLELGTYVAAPALGSMLGMLGATVVKVEPPEGDPTRKVTPWSWISYNWNKRSLALDLKSRDGLDAMKKLLKGTDVFVESLSPRAIKELGLDFESLRRFNDKIVCCSIKGFASDSESSHRVGFDTIAQAEGGLMHVVRAEDGTPSRVGNPCVDLAAATFGAVGVLAALLQKPRRAAHIEVPLYDVVVYWNGYWLPYIDIHGQEPSHLGSSHPGFSPYGVFRAQDGFVFIGVLSDAQWEKLVNKLGIKSDARYSDATERISDRDAVNSMVAEAVGKSQADRLLSELGDEVPCARVSSLMDIYANPELRERGVLRTVMGDGKSYHIALPPLMPRAVKKTMNLPALRSFHDRRRKRKGRTKEIKG
ncbi:MAG: CoA transferase [Nitrososphaerota archaeon]|nr:CoA transferase [Nitrososphaerota archaeon]